MPLPQGNLNVFKLAYEKGKNKKIKVKYFYYFLRNHHHGAFGKSAFMSSNQAFWPNLSGQNAF